MGIGCAPCAYLINKRLGHVARNLPQYPRDALTARGCCQRSGVRKVAIQRQYVHEESVAAEDQGRLGRCFIPWQTPIHASEVRGHGGTSDAKQLPDDEERAIGGPATNMTRRNAGGRNACEHASGQNAETTTDAVPIGCARRVEWWRQWKMSARTC